MFHLANDVSRYTNRTLPNPLCVCLHQEWPTYSLLTLGLSAFYTEIPLFVKKVTWPNIYCRLPPPDPDVALAPPGVCFSSQTLFELSKLVMFKFHILIPQCQTRNGRFVYFKFFNSHHLKYFWTSWDSNILMSTIQWQWLSNS